MINIYKDFKEGRLLRGLARVSVILVLAVVWILIDKGNIYGQSIATGEKLALKKISTAANQAPLLRQADESRDDDGILGDDTDEGTGFTAFPNPVKQDLVFDFEFTVKEAIPYEVISPLGRLVEVGQFEPGVNTQSLDFRRLKSGMYIVRLSIGGEAKITRIIKE